MKQPVCIVESVRAVAFTFPTTIIAPEKWCLGNYFPFGKPYFPVQTVSFRVPGTNSVAPYKTNEPKRCFCVFFATPRFFNFQGKGAEFKSFQNWMTGSMVEKKYCILPH